jgi:hypothetical protein
LKKQLHAKYKSTNDNVDYIEFSHIRSLCKYESKQCYNRYVSQAEDAINSDPRSFWRFWRSRNGLEGYPTCMKYNNKSSTDTGEIVNLFADFFQTVYKSLGETCYNCNILSMDEVFSGILPLKNPGSAGPDGIPAQFFVPCVFGLCKPIHHLFNLQLALVLFLLYGKIAISYLFTSLVIGV